MLFIDDFRIGCTIHGTSLKKGMQTVLQISQKLIFHRCLYIYIIRGNTGLSRIQELPKRNTAGSQLQICAPIYNAWTFTAKLQREGCQISAGLFHDQTADLYSAGKKDIIKALLQQLCIFTAASLNHCHIFTGKATANQLCDDGRGCARIGTRLDDNRISCRYRANRRLQ